jgi:hypothetical protein
LKQIDLARARELLKQAMETQGRDFVYSPTNHLFSTQCFYRPKPANEVERWGRSKTITGCLIGTALTIAGGEYFEYLVEDESIMGISQANPGLMTYQAADYFRRAQRWQDLGQSWGEAYDRAEEYADEGIPEIDPMFARRGMK